MILTPDSLRYLESCAIHAAKCAAEIIQKHAGGDFEVRHKEGGSSLASQVVTEIDLMSQTAILEELTPTLHPYQLGLLTEESVDDSSRFENNYFWCIDPLDGTLPFTKKIPGYSVAIALVSRNGVPEIGVIADPVSGTTYHAVRGTGARRDGQPWLSVPPAEHAPLTWAMDRSLTTQDDFEALRTIVQSIADDFAFAGVNVIDHCGAAMNAIHIAENAPGLYFKTPRTNPGGGSLWDFAASACILAELALPVADLKGAPLKLNREHTTFMHADGVLFASHGDLAAALRQRLPAG